MRPSHARTLARCSWATRAAGFRTVGYLVEVDAAEAFARNAERAEAIAQPKLEQIYDRVGLLRRS